LGSEDEFKSLCAAAKNYGIKIIVDAVLNHMTSDWNAIDSSLRDSSYYHSDKSSISNWEDRYQVTQRSLLNLYDLNTQNPVIQQKVLNFLKRAVKDGASGFRYDAAKHIELPDDEGFGGEFWPVITNNGAEFQYGEILSDKISRDSAYAKYIKVTASSYGYTIRDAIANNDFSINKIMYYNSNVSSNKLVTWVESHDNFSNNELESVWLTNEQIKLAWALLTARKSTTPLFFSRPVGAGGTAYDSRFPGKSMIGDEGDALYKDDEIAAVNLFRNAMEGEEEYLRNVNGSNKILMIERGTKGLVIINLNNQNTNIENITNLVDGEYQNHTNDKNIFKVSGGKIVGTLLSRSVTVLYKTNGNMDANSNSNVTSSSASNNKSVNGKINIYFKKPSSWKNKIYAYVYNYSSKVVSEVSKWPGLEMKYVSDSTYSISVSSDYENSYVIFNNIEQQIPESGESGFIIKNNGLYGSNGYEIQYKLNTVNSAVSSASTNTINIRYYSKWPQVYIHYKANNNSWTTSPGTIMIPEGNGYYRITLKAKNLSFVFNNGFGKWDNNNSKNYYIGSAGNYIISNGSIRNN
jgi:alpha-amylase